MAYLLIAAKFKIDLNDKFKYYCLEESCEKLVKVSKSNKSHNLKRHLEIHHPHIYSSIFSGVNKYEVLRLKLLQSCVELVTVNGRPLIALEDTGFQKSIEFQLDELAAHGVKLTVNRSTIKPYIQRIADAVRENMKIDLKNRWITLMADICTKNHRAVLGINAQYYSDGKIILRSIGMIEMHMRHTGENIKDLIVLLLKSYDVSMDQVYSFTSDNAAAMLRGAKLLSAEVDEQLREDDDDFDPSGNFARIMKELSDMMGKVYLSAQLPSVIGIGCAAHILQTLIHDALAKTYELTMISKVREIMILLRNQIYMIEIEARGAKLPILDGLTRWNSIYLMV